MKLLSLPIYFGDLNIEDDLHEEFTTLIAIAKMLDFKMRYSNYTLRGCWTVDLVFTIQKSSINQVTQHDSALITIKYEKKSSEPFLIIGFECPYTDSKDSIEVIRSVRDRLNKLAVENEVS